MPAIRNRARPLCRAALATLPLLFAGVASAGWPPPGVPSGVMPWEMPKYQGYAEPHGSRPAPADVMPQTPTKYVLHVTRLPYKQEYGDPTKALVVAHLPEDAEIYFWDHPTRLRGHVRQFLSPPLEPGKNLYYTVRVRWPEAGKWVEQMHTFPVRAGDVHCIDVVPADAATVEREVAASMAKLPPDDRRAAEAQRHCAVQNGIRLGSMGVPVKLTLQGQPVFLCCEACQDAARKNPAQTLEAVRKLKAKSAAE